MGRNKKFDRDDYKYDALGLFYSWVLLNSPTFRDRFQVQIYTIFRDSENCKQIENFKYDLDVYDKITGKYFRLEIEVRGEKWSKHGKTLIFGDMRFPQRKDNKPWDYYYQFNWWGDAVAILSKEDCDKYKKIDEDSTIHGINDFVVVPSNIPIVLTRFGGRSLREIKHWYRIYPDGRPFPNGNVLDWYK